MTDPFVNYPTQLESPAADFYAITPSDSADETEAFRGIYVGVGGDVAVAPLDGSAAVVFKNAGAGTTIPVRGVRVNSTSTTATDLVGLL